MRVLQKEAVLERLKKDACSSGHFVWLIGDFSFIETTNEWIFGYTKINQIYCFALEPLVPLCAGDYDHIPENEYHAAFTQLSAFLGDSVSSFTAVGESFVKRLHEFGYQSMQMGREPWVDLKRYMPTGNSGKGVRAARNQAIKGGVTIEEIAPAFFEEDSEIRRSILDIFKEWSETTFVRVDGFLLASEPFLYKEERRYFVARTRDRIEGYLIASPIYTTDSFYFEDLILRPDAVRGTSELLLLEAMRELSVSQAREVSLGIVGLKDILWTQNPPPKLFRGTCEVIFRIIPLFYNSSGIEVFRKRFKPQRWTKVYIAVKPKSPSKLAPSLQWVRAIFAILGALNLHFVFDLSTFLNKLLQFLRVHPLSLAWVMLLAFVRARSPLESVIELLAGAALLWFLERKWKSLNLIFFFLGIAGLDLLMNPDSTARNWDLSYVVLSFLGLACSQNKYVTRNFFATAFFLSLGVLLSVLSSRGRPTDFLVYDFFFLAGIGWGFFCIQREKVKSRLMARRKTSQPRNSA